MEVPNYTYMYVVECTTFLQHFRSRLSKITCSCRVQTLSPLTGSRTAWRCAWRCAWVPEHIGHRGSCFCLICALTSGSLTLGHTACAQKLMSGDLARALSAFPLGRHFLGPDTHLSRVIPHQRPNDPVLTVFCVKY